MQGRVRVMRREAVVLNEESHSRPKQPNARNARRATQPCRAHKSGQREQNRRYTPAGPATNPLQGLAGVGSRVAFEMAQLVSGDDVMANRMLLLASPSTAWLVLLLGPALKAASAACA